MEAQPPAATTATAIEQPFLSGTHEVSIDEKGRLLIPAVLRRALDPDTHGKAFQMMVGVNKKLWLYPDRYFQHLVTRQQRGIVQSKSQREFDLSLVARANHVAPDKAGRVMMTDRAMARCGLSKEVAVLGVADHIEIWDRQAWWAEEDRLADEMEATMERLRNGEG